MMRIKVLSLLFISTFMCRGLLAQQSYDLLINNKQISLPENKGKLPGGWFERRRQAFNGTLHVYVQFYTLPSDAQRKAFEAKGVRFLSYIPNNTYVCSVAKGSWNKFNDGTIRSVTFIAADNRINPSLTGGELPSWALKPNNQIDLLLTYYEDLPHADVKAALIKNKYEIISESDAMRHFQVRVKTDAIAKAASLNFIAYVDPERAPLEPENEVERTNHRSYAIDNNLTGVNGIHYDGAGVNVAVGDDGIIGPHIDYTGRVNQSFVTSNGGDHGDHVCGILGGAGNLNPKAKGMAPACSLFVYQPYSNINALPTSYTQYNIRITSLSYGQGCNAGYTSDANKIDNMMQDYPLAISVFSAGNSGTSNCNYKGTSITGWGNITGGMKAGKNVIAVANVWNNDSIEPSSSRGPASDGRIKPDISAVGTNVYSTVSTNSYTNNTGTSMSCPAISGVLAQLYQAYRTNNSGQDPQGALMKGVLLNTADDIGNPGPDYKFGYGRVNALKALRVIEQKRYMQSSVSNNDSVSLSITIPANVKRVKIMMYYADKEASVGASKAIVNDLNLTVTDSAGVVYKPWVLNPTPTVSALNSYALRKTDSLNNMEQVTFDNPTPGTVTVRVKGFQVPFGPQEFFIVYDFIYDSIRLVYPLGNDHWTPNATETIRWDSWNTTDLITVQTSPDNIAWTTVSSTIPGKNRLLSYTPSTARIGKMWVKIKQGTTESVTAQFVNVTQIPTNLKIDWICSGSCRISWTAVANASSYTVYRLGARYMDSVGNTTNNFFVFTGIDSTKDDWFSVSTMMSNDEIRGERANAVQKLKGIKLNCSTSITANFLNSRNNVCTNDTISFTPITNPLTGLNYSWSFPGGTPSSSNADLPVVRYNSPGTYDVSLSVSNDLGGVVVVKKLLITINGTTTNAGNDQAVCAGDSVTLNATGGVSFQWSLNKAIIGTTAALKVSPAQTSTYLLTSTSSTGCNAYDSVVVTVNPAQSKPAIVLNGGIFSTPTTAATYQWFRGGAQLSGATQSTYSPTASGWYKVRAGNASSCYNYSDEVFFMNTGINNLTGPEEISLFPNPNNGSFIISGVGQDASIAIYDAMGKNVVSRFIRTNAKDKISFAGNDLSKGVYLIRINDGEKTIKIVLE